MKKVVEEKKAAEEIAELLTGATKETKERMLLILQWENAKQKKQEPTRESEEKTPA